MNMRRCLLCLYRFLLQFYPAAFKNRYSAEMLELAAATEPAEWPLVFGDTTLAIVRCWFGRGRSKASQTESDAYLALGESPIRGRVLLPGLALSIAIVAGLSYVNYRWSPSSQCTKTLSESVHR
jgi:hypothetical protein